MGSAGPACIGLLSAGCQRLRERNSLSQWSFPFTNRVDNARPADRKCRVAMELMTQARCTPTEALPSQSEPAPGAATIGRPSLCPRVSA